MERADHFEKARQLARAKYGFYVHVGVYAAVMLLLVAINVIASPESFWVIWPLVGWGLAVALHAVRVFVLSGEAEIIDTLTERELKRADDDRSGKHL